MRTAAFSLLELLVVMAIIAMLSALAIPALNSISQGRGVENAGQVVADQVGYARQAAIARNRTMEVQFYKAPNPLFPGDPARYRALQVFELLDSGSSKPVGRVTKLPANMVMSEDAALSTLLSGTATQTNGATNIPGLGAVSEARSFQFRASGRTSLADMTALCFVTVVNERDASSSAPANFATIQVDPFNGRVRILRP